jgi:hypothetical protein
MSEPLPLVDLQRWFMEAVTGGSTRAEEHLAGTARFSATEGLSVYTNAYLERLVTCLLESFPAVARAVGEEAFRGLAVEYLHACPPAGPNLASLGAGFPPHLAATRPSDAADWADCLVELARYERALDEVFDGPGSEGGDSLSVEGLAAISPDAWASSRLVPSPALRLLRLAYPVDDYWGAIRSLEEGGVAPALPARRRQLVALSRRDHVVRRLVLDPDEFALLEGLLSGQPIGVAIAAVSGASSRADHALEEALTRWFARWMREGLFVGLARC